MYFLKFFHKLVKVDIITLKIIDFSHLISSKLGINMSLLNYCVTKQNE